MNRNTDITHDGKAVSQDKLANVLARLPLVPAPAALQARVWQALDARDARPWYRLPVTEWPLLTRLAVAVLAALALLVLWQLCTAWTHWLADAPSGGAVARTFAFWQAVHSTLQSLREALVQVLIHLPRGLRSGLVMGSAVSFALCGAAGWYVVRSVRVREALS